MSLSSVYTLTASQLAEYFNDDNGQEPYDLLVLDVRKETFYRSSHIKGAINFPIEGRCSGIEMVETMMRRVPWEYLFSEKHFYNIVLYTESTPLTDVVKEFFEHMLSGSDLGDGKREWRRVYMLDKGFSHFHTSYSKLCTGAPPTTTVSSPIATDQQIKINEQLWVGNVSPLQDTDVSDRLRRRGITSIILLGNGCHINKPAINPHHVRILEVEESAVAKQFSSTLCGLFRQIDDEKKTVYVCCRNGKTYAAALAIAYLMTEGNRKLLDVYSEVNAALEDELQIPCSVMAQLAQVEQAVCSRLSEHVYPMIKCTLPPKKWILLEGQCEKVDLLARSEKEATSTGCHVM